MAAARAEAAKRGSFPILLTYDDPDVDVAVIVATFTAADWAIYSDLAARDSGDAHSAAYVEQTLWPTGADAAALGDGTPALHDLVASDLHEMAGGGREHERVRLVEGMRAADLLRFGLTPEKVTALLAGANGAKLFAVLITGEPSISLVVKTPLKPVYRSGVNAVPPPRASHSGHKAPGKEMGVDMIVHSSPPLEDIERTCPAVITNNLVTIFIEVGGAGAKATRRRL
jgi:hypothetical protein